jgi:predicted nucleic acid-binding Zn ribbon protein
MSFGPHKQEDWDCVVCGKKFKRSASYVFELRKVTCSNKCRLIKWAIKEKNKMEIDHENKIGKLYSK